MRLNPEEHAAILEACRQVLAHLSWELRLYGSRADDTQRGGDIDLAIVLAQDQPPAGLLALPLQLADRIQAAIGEQKIDLSILGAQQLDQAFWRLAMERYVSLGRHRGGDSV